MENEQKKSKDEENKNKEAEKRRRRIEWFNSLKEKDNYRGVLCNVDDTYGLIDLARHYDMVINILRANIYKRFPPEKVDPFFRSFNDVILIMERLTEITSELVGHTKYKRAQHIKEVMKTHSFSAEAKIYIDMIENLRPKNNEKSDNNEESNKIAETA